MRLRNDEIAAIKAVARKGFGGDVLVRLSPPARSSRRSSSGRTSSRGCSASILMKEAYDLSPTTARDVANVMERLGGLEDPYVWSDLVKLRNRLAREYWVSPSAQIDRVREAFAAKPVLRAIIAHATTFAADRGYLR